MATAAEDDLSANVYIANPVETYRCTSFPAGAGNAGSTGLLIGTIRCAANGTIVRTSFDEVFHTKATNMTDIDEEVQTSVSTGAVTFNTVTAGDLITYKIVGRSY